MTEQEQHSYRFLDSEQDRQALIEDIRQVRGEVRKLAERVPQDQWYTPRYHGWSLAAMLGHLQLMDRLQMWWLSLGILGVQIPVSRSAMNSFNDMTAGIYKRRMIETSLRGLEKNETRVADFIRQLPVNKFSRRVFDPATQRMFTVEQAIQEYFLYHWREHLQTIRMADDIHYEPPTGSTIA